MKKSIIALLICALIILSTVSTAVYANLVQSPNKGYSTNLGGGSYEGYVQCQPSFIENGRHAARGYMHFEEYASGVRVYTDSEYCTAYGTGPNDSRILSKECEFSVSESNNTARFKHSFMWIDDGTGVWPLNNPIEDVTE